MATIAPIEHASPTMTTEIPTLPVYRLSVDQSLAMVRTGVLTEDDWVELIEGWIVPKMGRNPPHAVATRELFDAL